MVHQYAGILQLFLSVRDGVQQQSWVNELDMAENFLFLK